MKQSKHLSPESRREIVSLIVRRKGRVIRKRGKLYFVSRL